jgi:predicted type IV restriction endonuclease
MNNKLPVYVSESDFSTYVLPHLSHKIGHNRQKVSYHYIFNTILYVLKSGCSWRTLKPENQLVTWQNIYYHYAKWSADDSFLRLFEASRSDITHKLALECLQLDGTHTPSKKGAKK